MTTFYPTLAPTRVRHRLIVSFAATLLATCAPWISPAAGGVLITHDEAARNGLERAWFAQIPLDPRRSRVTTWYLYFDRLYGVTDSGIMTALDAETGAQLWSKQVGKQGYEAFGPGANDKYLGIVSGAKLYLLDRHDGRLEWVRELGSAPASGPALSSTYAFVALMSGRVEGYKLEDPTADTWYYQSKGRTYLRPTATGSIVSWPTADGYLYVSRADNPGVLFRLETNDDIVTSPAAEGEYLYIASLDGYLYAMNESTGRERWRYATGFSITSSPAIVGGQAYVASLEPALHAVDLESGQGLWTAPGASHFAAKGAERVYASEKYGNLLVLDGKTGRPISRLALGEGLSTIVNDQSNRIFVVNDRGLVQCLLEIGADEPTMYRQPIAPPAPPTEDGATTDAAPAEQPERSAAEQPAEEAADAEAAAEPVEDAAEPMEEAAEPQAAPEEDNPFEEF